MRESRGLVVAFCAVAMLAACGENMHARYANLDALQKAGSGARSWFPASLPTSAVDIEEWHNLDTNGTIGRFRFSTKELESFRNALAAQRITGRLNGADLAMRDVADWPVCLKGKVDEDDVGRCGFEAYRLRDFEIAIDPESCTAYFWTT